MHLVYRNVNKAFNGLVKQFKTGLGEIAETNSRNGPVRYFQEPVTITYERPTERVLFNTARDANPFFHLFESMWMLAGRNDVDSLARYVSKYRDYSDDGKTLNGAYGYRWRRHLIQGNYVNDGEWIDQLEILVNHLKETPNSRRAVLSIWNVEDDLLKVNDSLDVCCNISACFAIRDPDSVLLAGPNHPTKKQGERLNPKLLDMTVFNRSNDMVWGTCGEDLCHFSFLQEYIAASLDCSVGKYHQVSNNLHVYTETNSGWHPDKWIEKSDEYSYDKDVKMSIPLVHSVRQFEIELQEFVDCEDWSRSWDEPFFHEVAAPMMWAHKLHKDGSSSAALVCCKTIVDDAWRIAATNWITKRKENKEKKNALKFDSNCDS